MTELKKRASARGKELKFSVKQLRTKFKKCVGDCKQAALTIRTATGIKRFQEDRGLGNWFKPLFAVVQTRDEAYTKLLVHLNGVGIPVVVSYPETQGLFT